MPAPVIEKLEVRERSLFSDFCLRTETFIDIVEEDLRGLSRPDASDTSICSVYGGYVRIERFRLCGARRSRMGFWRFGARMRIERLIACQCG